jgi:hypothetical protein
MVTMAELVADLLERAVSQRPRQEHADAARVNLEPLSIAIRQG